MSTCAGKGDRAQLRRRLGLLCAWRRGLSLRWQRPAAAPLPEASTDQPSRAKRSRESGEETCRGAARAIAQESVTQERRGPQAWGRRETWHHGPDLGKRPDTRAGAISAPTSVLGTPTVSGLGTCGQTDRTFHRVSQREDPPRSAYFSATGEFLQLSPDILHPAPLLLLPSDCATLAGPARGGGTPQEVSPPRDPPLPPSPVRAPTWPERCAGSLPTRQNQRPRLPPAADAQTTTFWLSLSLTRPWGTVATESKLS